MKKIEIASFLSNVAEFRRILMERQKANTNLINVLEKFYKDFEEIDFNYLESKISEVSRDIKILDRRMALMLEKVQKLGLLEKTSTKLTKMFIEIIEDNQNYSEKWKNIYKSIFGKLSEK